MAIPSLESLPVSSIRIPFLGDASVWLPRVALALRDAWWYLTHKQGVLKAAIGFAVVVLGLFIAQHVFTGHIFPNVWALGVHVGDLTVEEAKTALQDAWEHGVRIQLVADGQTVATVTPKDLGLELDARMTAEDARAVGMAGLPMGYDIAPHVTADYVTAQNYLLDLWDRLNVQPYNAGYEWQDGELVGVTGREGRQLEVVLTLERMMQDVVGVVSNQRLDLLISPVAPDVMDPTPYLEDARQLASQPIQLIGYDPFRDETLIWTTSKEDFTRWLEASPVGLKLREDVFEPYIKALDAQLNNGDDVRFLDPTKTMQQVSEAINNKQNAVTLRIEYRPVTYTIVAGDTGFRIARKTGIPFYLIDQANPGRDWGALPIGDQILLPTRDQMLPEPPVPNKRIVVNLDTFVLVAYENGQEKFKWKVSTGLDTAPTAPGIYQILNHDELAIGSGVELCGNNGCGQWEMNWFMGIYQISPGLINGFHGAVRLPNGYLLNGGNVGGRDTYGCIMSEDNNAKMLYDWAEEGTVVEIISNEFEPQSALGRQAKNVSL